MTRDDTDTNEQELQLASLNGNGLGKAKDNLTTSVSQRLADAVAEKTKGFKPDDGGQSQFESKEQIGYFQMIRKVMDTTDTILLTIGFLGATLLGAAVPGFCLLFGDLVDGVGASTGTTDDFDSLKDQAVLMVYVGVGVLFTCFFQISFFSLFAESIANKMKLLYFKACLEKDATYYDEHSPTEMSAKIAKEVGAIQTGLGEKVGQLIMSINAFVFGIAFSFYWGWLLALILIGAMPILGLMGSVLGMVLQSGATEVMKEFAQSSGYAEQALQAIKVVKTYSCEALEHSNFVRYLDRASQMQKKLVFKASLGHGLFQCIILNFYAYTLFWGGFLKWREVKNGDEEYTGGAIIAILFSVIIGAMNMGGAGAHMKAVSEAKVAGKLAFETIDQVPSINPLAENKKLLTTVKGQIEFKNVNFTYPTRQELQVLKNFSAQFELGKTTAVVGPSGSGKSTIVQMIERFYDPTSGSVTLDGEDLKTLDVRSLRQSIGYVGQEPVLFNTSIRENMLFAQPDASDKDIEDALRAAKAWDFIQEKMGSKGIDQNVGGSGSQLSGGQKQRIAIARAILKKPKILLLDEATSALDRANEKAVQEAIDDFRRSHGDITIIVVAHRLSTIRDADKILVMKNGELVESGTHEELISQYADGVYHTFVKKQESAEAHHQDDYDHDATADGKPDEKKEEDPEVSRMKEKVDAIDKEIEDAEAKLAEERAKVSAFSKIMPYNQPKAFVFSAIVGAALGGLNNPLFGVMLSNLLGVLTLSVPVLAMTKGEDYLADTIKENCLIISAVGLLYLFSGFAHKYSFGQLGANVTLRIREVLYGKILEKHLGWFDDRDNSSGHLSAVLSQEASVINGVSTESIGPQIEAAVAMLLGLGIGFYYCWREAAVCLVLSPLLVVGQGLGVVFTKGMAMKSAELQKEANLLCSDAITNFKTVQSFGHEKQINNKYETLLAPIFKLARSSNIKAGLAFGFAQFGQYFVFASMFYAGGQIIKNHYNEDTGELDINPDDVFKAIFTILFSASQAGMALSMGPDMGKASAAAENIFKIIDSPSKINHSEIGKDTTKIRIQNPETIKGRIEFKDVWFRYPTRKEDFVLKGLNLTIDPEEKVALVGESGCGKSTMMNLLMRFYDVDSGALLLDGVNIKDYDLFDLRRAVSLVMQEPIIFNYSILENILYGKLNATNGEVLQAAAISNCEQFIEGSSQDLKFDDSAQGLIREMEKNKSELIALIGSDKFDEEMEILVKMEKQEQSKGAFLAIEGNVDTRGSELKRESLPHGYGVICGIKGGKLSGGQKQRVAIARSIIRKPKVLILDEATSALDEDNQKQVQQALEKAMTGRTTIIIAHRMSTIENCERIFVLADGKVKEEGNFNELKTKGGYFAKMSRKAS